jgi:hypothetical protein
MAAPVITPSLAPEHDLGAAMEMHIAYSDADNWTRVDTITITGTDQDGNAAVVTVQTTVVSEDEVLLTIEDDSGRVWTKQSDDGSTAVYTATA